MNVSKIDSKQSFQALNFKHVSEVDKKIYQK